jgi:hypothetical protein
MSLLSIDWDFSNAYKLDSVTSSFLTYIELFSFFSFLGLLLALIRMKLDFESVLYPFKTQVSYIL